VLFSRHKESTITEHVERVIELMGSNDELCEWVTRVGQVLRTLGASRVARIVEQDVLFVLPKHLYYCTKMKLSFTCESCS
jgi:hypothetical protein